MEEEPVESLVDSDIQELDDANAISDLSLFELALVGGGIRGCGLLHIDK